MGKTSERLETYQTQMSIYAEQHKIILASDVLDMIEQLQDDLKDDISNVVEELDNAESVKIFGSLNSGNRLIPVSDAIEIVKRGGVE